MILKNLIKIIYFIKGPLKEPMKEPINKSVKEPIKSEPKTRLNEIRQVEEKPKKENRRSAAGLLGNGLGKAQTACTPLTKIATAMCPLGLFLSLVLPLVALGLLIPFLSNKKIQFYIKFIKIFNLLKCLHRNA